MFSGGVSLLEFCYSNRKNVSFQIRLLSCVMTTIPALVYWYLISMLAGSDYFWKTYLIVGEIFLAISMAIGFIFPSLILERWKRHPVLWLFIQGMLAWTATVIALAFFNLTPLCIGQNNGDGNNDLILCMVQTSLVSIVYSPLEFVLLCLTVLPGGWLIQRYVESRQA
jgi:hypothetical protein